MRTPKLEWWVTELPVLLMIAAVLLLFALA